MEPWYSFISVICHMFTTGQLSDDKDDEGNPCVKDQPTIKCQLKCVEKQDHCVIEEEPCSIDFELEYQVYRYIVVGI